MDEIKNEPKNDDKNAPKNDEKDDLVVKDEGIDFKDVPEPIQKFIAELKAEARTRRLKNRELSTELKIIKDKQTDIDKKALEEKGEYKT